MPAQPYIVGHAHSTAIETGGIMRWVRERPHRDRIAVMLAQLEHRVVWNVDYTPGSIVVGKVISIEPRVVNDKHDYNQLQARIKVHWRVTNAERGDAGAMWDEWRGRWAKIEKVTTQTSDIWGTNPVTKLCYLTSPYLRHCDLLHIPEDLRTNTAFNVCAFYQTSTANGGLANAADGAAGQEHDALRDENAQLRHALRRARVAERPDNEYASYGECVVCQSAPANHALWPCGHVCLCKDCVKEARKRITVCPYCRERIQGDPTEVFLDTAPENPHGTYSKCVMCKSGTADHIMRPCGHVCLCKVCAKQASGRNRGIVDCPECRKRIDGDPTRVYLSTPCVRAAALVL